MINWLGQNDLVANIIHQNSTLIDQIKQLQNFLTVLTASKTIDTSKDNGSNGRGDGGGSYGNRRVNNDD